MESVFKQLEALEKSSESTRPSAYALRTCRIFLFQLPISTKCSIESNGKNGIQVKWNSEKEYVRLEISSSFEEKPRIFEYNSFLKEETESDSLIDSLFGY